MLRFVTSIGGYNTGEQSQQSDFSVQELDNSVGIYKRYSQKIRRSELVFGDCPERLLHFKDSKL